MDNKMTNAAPLPAYLIQRFQGWKASKFVENNFLYKRLAEEGQHPPAMVISCCDSRVNVTALFEADPGEFFIHRNVANLVPPFSPTGDYHGTSAAIEYAVTSLGVAHIMFWDIRDAAASMGAMRCVRAKHPNWKKAPALSDAG